MRDAPVNSYRVIRVTWLVINVAKDVINVAKDVMGHARYKGYLSMNNPDSPYKYLLT